MNANAKTTNDRDSNDIRSRRQSLGLSQQALAGLAGCSISLVRLAEGGYRVSEGADTRLRRALDEAGDRSIG